MKSIYGIDTTITRAIPMAVIKAGKPTAARGGDLAAGV
jgi:hypothetical protein